MTAGRLNRSELSRIVGGDPRAIREFERVLSNVQANINGASSITLNYSSAGVLTSPLPVTSSFTLNPENGSAFTSGVSWGVTVLSGSFTGPEPTIGGTGTGILQINSGIAGASALIAVTATVNGVGYPPFSVSLVRSTATPDTPGGGGTASDSTSAILTFNTGTFAAITRELSITLPAGVTTATLTTGSIFLEVESDAPAGGTACQVKWQRETAPSVWSDVGAVAGSFPSPFVLDEGGGIYAAGSGEVMCNRTETGMVAASPQKFRLVARVSSGNVRTVFPFGTASVTS